MMSSDLVLSESVVFWLIHVVLFRLSSLDHCSLVREQKHNAWLESESCMMNITHIQPIYQNYTITN